MALKDRSQKPGKRTDTGPEYPFPREDTAEPGEAGSIEQKLDMVEKGKLRGDEVLHHHGVLPRDGKAPDVLDENQMMENYSEDMSEPQREGDEMSGDEHSGGLQGEELFEQAERGLGLPGDESRTDAQQEEERAKRRTA